MVTPGYPALASWRIAGMARVTVQTWLSPLQNTWGLVYICIYCIDLVIECSFEAEKLVNLWKFWSCVTFSSGFISVGSILFSSHRAWLWDVFFQFFLVKFIVIAMCMLDTNMNKTSMHVLECFLICNCVVHSIPILSKPITQIKIVFCWQVEWQQKV